VSLNVTDFINLTATASPGSTFTPGGPSLNFLGSVFWQFATFIIGIVAVIGFLVYHYYITPPIGRQMIAAKWSKGVPCFIENEVGIVDFTTTDRHLPEGVKHIKHKGWFANAIRDVTEVESEDKGEQRGPGRPRKNGVSPEKVDEKQNDEILEMITHTPMLNGLGKQVFFGSTTSVALTGLKTIAHADLRKTRLLSPRMYSKTQLDALATGNRIEGLKMAGKDAVKLIVMCLVVIAPIVVTGLIIYLLTSGGKPA
jgi:hypothetical protein